MGDHRIAVSTIDQGVLLLDLESGETTYPDFNHLLVGECVAPRLFRAGSRWLLHGGWSCWGELSPDLGELRPLAPLPTASVKDVRSHSDEPDRLWIATDSGLLDFDLRTGEHEWHRPNVYHPNVSAPGTNFIDVEVVEDRLWAATLDGALGFLDLSAPSSAWRSVPGVCGVTDLVPTREGRFLALGGTECVGRPEVWSFDPQSLAYEPAALPWEDFLSYPDQIFDHAGYVWMIGPIQYEGPPGLVGFSRDEERFRRLGEDPMAAGRSLVASERDPEALWLTSGGRLMRLEVETLQVEEVRRDVLGAGALGDGRLWIRTEELSVFDPLSRESDGLGVDGWPVQDPRRRGASVDLRGKPPRGGEPGGR